MSSPDISILVAAFAMTSAHDFATKDFLIFRFELQTRNGIRGEVVVDDDVKVPIGTVFKANLVDGPFVAEEAASKAGNPD